MSQGGYGRLCLDGGIQVQCNDAADPTLDLSTFDVVCLAALVGADADAKLHILSSIVKRMRPGAAVLIRSALALRQLMYPAGLPLPLPFLHKSIDQRTDQVRNRP